MKQTNKLTDLEFDILVLKRLHVEPDGGDGLNVVVRVVLQAVEDGRLSGVVEAEDENTHLLRPEQGLENSAHDDPHLYGAEIHHTIERSNDPSSD